MPINFAIKLAATIAIEAAQMGLQASKRTMGPRLDELTVTVAEYGTPLPRFLGARKFSCPIFHAEQLKEVEKSSKVKGAGKQTTYHYLATFACAISDCAIDEVLKIWFDDKIVYDATGTGPMSYASALGFDLSSVMRIYKGTEDQLPDPRYASWCEDKYGPDSAPPYRGISYLFFEEMPVDNFGNRIPQITVLATAAATPHFPYQIVTTDRPAGYSFIFGGSTMAYVDPFGAVEWWDVPSRTLLGSSLSAESEGLVSRAAFSGDGTLYYVGWQSVGVTAHYYLISTTVLGAPQFNELDISGVREPFGVTRVLGGSVLTTFVSETGYIDGATFVSDSKSARDFCEDTNGNIWGLFQPTGSSNAFTLRNLNTGTSADFTSGTTRSGPGFATVAFVSGHLFVYMGGYFYIIDPDTLSVTSSGVLGAAPDYLPQDGSTSVWIEFDQYSMETGALIRSLDKTDWLTTSDGTYAYDPLNNAIWGRKDASSDIVVYFIDRVASAGTTLGDIVDAMCDAASLSDRDTSLLTQEVQGYSWTRGDVKSQMDPVLDIHDVDARPHDFTIEFLPRGSSPTKTILTQDFAKAEGARYKLTFAQDTDLPAILRVNFADTGFDQQTNNVLSPLPTDSVDSQRDDTIDLTTYAATPDEAQQLADRYIRRQWNSRETIENSLTAQFLDLEPGDVTALSLDGIVQNARLTKQTIAGGKIDCTFVRDETALAALNSATTGPNMDGRDVPTIVIPAPVKGFVIDAPLKSDADSDVRPLLYASAGSYASLTFPGAVIYEATGTGTALAYDQLFSTVPTGATWGICLTVLADANPWLWDRGNTLTVTMQGGSVTSVSEADIDADASLNLIYVGSEYLNFTTATLNGDGSYTLSGFKRGRRGTEWACGSHVSGEAMIFASSLDADEMGADEVGASKSFKAQSVGRGLETAPAISFTFTGASLKPYAPSRIKWTTDGTDLFGEIIRRTRVGGSWIGGSTIPLSENSESYEVDVYHSTTLKRTISVTGNTFTYTAAMISADGNAVTSPPPVDVYQLSDAVGRGFALAA